MKMNDLQKALLASYADGEYAHIQRGEDLRECGDGLLKFLFEELGEDCYAEAIGDGLTAHMVALKRLNGAMENIMQVHRALA